MLLNVLKFAKTNVASVKKLQKVKYTATPTLTILPFVSSKNHNKKCQQEVRENFYKSALKDKKTFEKEKRLYKIVREMQVANKQTYRICGSMGIDEVLLCFSIYMFAVGHRLWYRANGINGKIPAEDLRKVHRWCCVLGNIKKSDVKCWPGYKENKGLSARYDVF